MPGYCFFPMGFSLALFQTDLVSLVWFEDVFGDKSSNPERSRPHTFWQRYIERSPSKAHFFSKMDVSQDLKNLKYTTPPYWSVHGSDRNLVSKLVHNLFTGLTTYLYRGYNPFTKYHGHPSAPLRIHKLSEFDIKFALMRKKSLPQVTCRLWAKNGCRLTHSHNGASRAR